MKDPLPLLSHLFDGTLTEAEAEELRTAIKNDPRFANEVALVASMHRDLHDLLAGQGKLGGIPDEFSGLGDAHIMPALEEEEELPATRRPPASLPYVRLQPRKYAGTPPVQNLRHKHLTWRAVAGLGIAAALLVGIGVGLWYRSDQSAATVKIASIDNLMNVHWATGQAPLHEGDSLGKSRLAIASGLLRLTFAGGASVVAEGPAELQLDSPGSMRLLSGRLTTAVPHEAVGFTVGTPAASVIDLGTEVGIHVADDNQTHVEVFKGRAKVDMPDAAGQATMASAVLEPSMAVNVQARGTAIEKAAPEPLAFVRQDQLLELARSADTPFATLQAERSRLLQDPSLVAYYTFENQADSPYKLLNHAPRTFGQMDGILQQVIWDQGRLPGQQALHFAAHNSQVSLTVPGTFNQLTLATWVNFEELSRNYSVLFSVDHRTAGGFDWKFLVLDGLPVVNIAVATDPLKVGHYSGGIFNASGIDTGHWHYCVFNYDFDAKVIRCSVDGRWLKPLSKPIDIPQVPAKIDEATIGNELHLQDARNFRGRMDEFAIWSRTLSDDEITAMYKSGLAR